MRKGLIVMLPFPFTSLLGSKGRPALVLAVRSADVTVAFISSRVQNQRPADVLVLPSAMNGLRLASLISTDKLASIETRLVSGEFGELDYELRAEVNDKLLAALRLPISNS